MEAIFIQLTNIAKKKLKKKNSTINYLKKIN